MKLHMGKKILDSLPSLVEQGDGQARNPRLEQLQKHKHVKLEQLQY